MIIKIMDDDRVTSVGIVCESNWVIYNQSSREKNFKATLERKQKLEDGTYRATYVVSNDNPHETDQVVEINITDEMIKTLREMQVKEIIIHSNHNFLAIPEGIIPNKYHQFYV